MSGKNIILWGKCQGILNRLKCGNPELSLKETMRYSEWLSHLCKEEFLQSSYDNFFSRFLSVSVYFLKTSSCFRPVKGLDSYEAYAFVSYLSVYQISALLDKHFRPPYLLRACQVGVVPDVVLDYTQRYKFEMKWQRMIRNVILFVPSQDQNCANFNFVLSNIVDVFYSIVG